MRNPPSSSSSSSAPAAAAATGGGGTKTTPCCSKVGLKRGPWTPEEDELLAKYIKREGEGKWRNLPKRAGLLRCGKSCRLRWMNYLRPSVKRGHIAPDEEDLILRLHRLLGNRWSLIAGRIPGRTDNEIKNYWNTHLSKKLISQGIDPRTHKPLQDAQQDNNKNQKGVSLSSSKPLATTPNPNPVQNHMLNLSDTSDDSTTGVGAADGGDTNHQNINANGLILPSNGIINVAKNHLDFETSFPGATNNNNVDNNNSAFGESPVSLKDEDADPNYCTDEVFSSFLNSLINEDVFTSQTQQLLPHYEGSLTQPVPFSAAGWGAPPLMSTNTTSAAGNFHHNPPDDQPQCH